MFTVYDRIDDLAEAVSLAEITRTDAEDNHYAEYRTRLDHLAIDVTDEGSGLVAQYADREETAARRHALWSDLR